MFVEGQWPMTMPPPLNPGLTKSIELTLFRQNNTFLLTADIKNTY